MTQVPVPRETEQPPGDDQFFRAFRLGLIVGVPAAFVAVLAMTALATGGLGYVVAAAWAAIVGGPFFGGVTYLNLLYAHEHPAHAATRAPSPPVAHRPRLHRPRTA